VLRGFYALDDARTPYFLNVLQNGLNIVLAWPLVEAWGVPGLGWAYALSYLVAAPVALVVLARRLGGFAIGRLAARCVGPAVAAVVVALVLALLVRPIRATTWAGSFGITLVGGVLGLVIYVVGLVGMRPGAARSGGDPGDR
jgi:putative peptidoglycan lipid II flippase